MNHTQHFVDWPSWKLKNYVRNPWLSLHSGSVAVLTTARAYNLLYVGVQCSGFHAGLWIHSVRRYFRYGNAYCSACNLVADWWGLATFRQISNNWSLNKHYSIRSNRVASIPPNEIGYGTWPFNCSIFTEYFQYSFAIRLPSRCLLLKNLMFVFSLVVKSLFGKGLFR